jgi:DNA-binding CsgD family transcriptional regulator
MKNKIISTRRSYRNLIIVVTSNDDVFNRVSKIIKMYSAKTILHVNNVSALHDELEKCIPSSVFIECNFWYSATPYRMFELQLKNQGLRLSVFNTDRLLKSDKARFITVGKAHSFIDMRSSKMHGEVKEYMFAFEETLNGNSYISDWLENAIEKYATDTIDGYSEKRPLTNHQLEVARLTALGRSPQEIGTVLHSTASSVNTVQQAVRTKFGINAQREMVFTMINLGYLSIKEIEDNCFEINALNQKEDC